MLQIQCRISRIIGISISLMGLTFISQSGFAADQYPSRPIRVVVPYPAGGSADLLGRLVAQKINKAIPNSKVIVENKAGGATVPAAMDVLRDTADGHSLFMASDNTLNINRWLLQDPRYDGDKDFTPVTVLNTYPHWLIVNASGKYKNFDDLVNAIRDNPGKISISVNTVGGSAYLALDNWRRANNFKFEIVPYRGSPPAVADLIGGQTDAHLDVVGSSANQARSGRVLPVVVLQSEPLKEFPKVATQSYDDPKALTVRANLSVVVKSGTPKDVVDRLYAAINAGAKETDFVEALESLNYAPVLYTPDQARKFILSETERYRKLVEKSGLEKQ